MSLHRGNQNFTLNGGIKNGLILYYDASSSFLSSSYGVADNNTNWNSIIGPNLTLYGSPTYTGSVGGNVKFYKSSNQNATYNSSGPVLTNTTFTAWFQISADDGAVASCCNQVSNGSYDFNNGFCIYYESTLGPGITIEGGFRGGGGYNTTNFFGVTPTLNQWYNFTFTVDSSFITSYVNGVAKVSASRVNNGSSTIDFSTFCLGSRCGANSFFTYLSGSVAMAMVYNRALSSTEIATIYSGSKGRFGL